MNNVSVINNWCFNVYLQHKEKKNKYRNKRKIIAVEKIQWGGPVQGWRLGKRRYVSKKKFKRKKKEDWNITISRVIFYHNICIQTPTVNILVSILFEHNNKRGTDRRKIIKRRGGPQTNGGGKSIAR